jgi:hypothetical protein
MKERKKKTYTSIDFATQNYAVAPNQRKVLKDTEKGFFEEDNAII